jgi:hypothetical protein
MNVELNIGAPTSCREHFHTAAAARKALQPLAEGFGWRFLLSAYQGPDSPVEEGTVVIELRGVHSPSLIWPAVHNLAAELGEDCIGVLVLEDGQPDHGFLIGPNAEKWGAFRFDFFHRFLA